jgi:hypothetical protein
MSDLLLLTSAQLNHAADLKEKISELQEELASIVGTDSSPALAPKKQFKMGAAGRTKIAAAQKARWAKVKEAESAAKPIKRRKMSAAGRAKIAAAAKARWAKVKAAGKTSL